MPSLDGKTIVLGVTGSIAAYKAADLTSQLTKRGAQVFCVMTKEAAQIIQPSVASRRSIVPDLSRDSDRRHHPVVLAIEAIRREEGNQHQQRCATHGDGERIANHLSVVEQIIIEDTGK